MKKCVICDLDNVFIDSREWNHFLPTGKNRKEWEEYQKKCLPLCKPNHEIINHIITLSKGTPIIFLTGREGTDLLKQVTIHQIEEYSKGEIKIGNKHKLIMREPEVYDSASIVKEKALKELLKEYTPLFAIDDDPENVKMFEQHGILTIHYTKLG